MPSARSRTPQQHGSCHSTDEKTAIAVLPLTILIWHDFLSLCDLSFSFFSNMIERGKPCISHDPKAKERRSGLSAGGFGPESRLYLQLDPLFMSAGAAACEV